MNGKEPQRRGGIRIFRSRTRRRPNRPARLAEPNRKRRALHRRKFHEPRGAIRTQDRARVAEVPARLLRPEESRTNSLILFDAIDGKKSFRYPHCDFYLYLGIWHDSFRFLLLGLMHSTEAIITRRSFRPSARPTYKDPFQLINHSV